MRKYLSLLAVLCATALCSCAVSRPGPCGSTFPLAQARCTFKTQIVADSWRGPVDEPPPELFSVVHYDAPLGSNVAYASPVEEGARRAAIVWLVGGSDWGVSEYMWPDEPRENDQSASAFRKADMVLMLPALRGWHDNPGDNQCFLGEVDDVIAAADYLASRPDVDPDRIYLGGHSTGGTMALLAAASSNRYRAVFAFGPREDATLHKDCVPEGTTGEERRLRAPVEHMADITTPTFVIEGEEGNLYQLRLLEERRGDAPITFIEVPGADHFTVLLPGEETIVEAIAADVGNEVRLSITAEGILSRMQ